MLAFLLFICMLAIDLVRNTVQEEAECTLAPFGNWLSEIGGERKVEEEKYEMEVEEEKEEEEEE